MRKTASFGSWKSSISAADSAAGTIRYGLLRGRDDELYWSESRPQEAGRSVIVRAGRDGRVNDILPAPYSARSRVHEYGGGEFFFGKTGLYFINAEDQDVYHLGLNKTVKRITHAPEWRFADGTCDPLHDRLITVAEKHGQPQPQNLITSIALDGKATGKPEPLLQGHDFYASPRLNRENTLLAWLEWDLPDMPWDSARLKIGHLDARGRVTGQQILAGGKGMAASEPQWDKQGRLVFIAEKDGWSTIHRWDGQSITALPWPGHEFGRPLWSLGAASYAITDDGRIVALSFKDGEPILASFHQNWEIIDSPARQIDAITTANNQICVTAATDTAPPAICALGEPLTPLGKPAIRIAPQNISRARTIAFSTGDGVTAHGLYYPPCNPDFSAPPGEKPPAILCAHGGPTGMADRGLKLKTQYWTSRGFAVFDIDYRGSSGYGRKWRTSLNGHWGIADVQDMENGARHLVATGLADPDRLVISGSSAGGFTVLATLCRSSLFAAGASYYGIGDLAKLQAITHKFESGYLQTLLGEGKEVFRQRSPLFQASSIQTPVIFFQGANDPVVPPSQSRDMHESLKNRGIATSYIEFEGESHGFRQAETIIRALKSEYRFYAQILGLSPVEDLPPIRIENFTAR